MRNANEKKNMAKQNSSIAIVPEKEETLSLLNKYFKLEIINLLKIVKKTKSKKLKKKMTKMPH